jgi:hypothetical protein
MASNDVKTVADSLIADFANGMPATLRVFEAIPTGHLNYQPDPEAKTGLGLVCHITLEGQWLLNIADGQFTPPDASDARGIMNPADAIARHKEKVLAALDRIRAVPADKLTATLDRSA